MMILQPDFVAPETIILSKAEVEKKRGINLEPLETREYYEVESAQTLHIGPFSEEGPVIAALHDFIVKQNRALDGKHHEIYLSDIRRTPSSRWKTIIRQPFR